jgi:hypothetical protein
MGVHLGDVERRAGALAEPEHRGHAGPPGRRHQRPDRFRVDRQGMLRVPDRVDRPGQGELREHRDVAALGPRLLQHGHVALQVAGHLALRRVDRRQQDTHPVLWSGTSIGGCNRAVDSWEGALVRGHAGGAGTPPNRTAAEATPALREALARPS